MKKPIIFVLILCALFACAHAEEAPIWQPLLDQWNAQTGEELHQSMCRYLMAHISRSQYTPGTTPCKIRIGGTTAELLADKGNWDMAIVSSSQVDLNALIEAQLIACYSYGPNDDIALHEWLLSDEIRALLPCDPHYIFAVYVFDYREETHEALLLIEQSTLWRKKSHYINCAYEFIPLLLRTRPAAQVRKIEGINVVYDWPAADLLSRASEWDVALLENFPEKDLTALEQAFLLTDLSSSNYFATRDTVSTHPSCRDRWNNTIYGTDGRIIACQYNENGGNTHIMLVNALGVNPTRAIAFAEHLVKSYEWYFHAEERPIPKNPTNPYVKKSLYIPRSEVDW